MAPSITHTALTVERNIVKSLSEVGKDWGGEK